MKNKSYNIKYNIETLSNIPKARQRVEVQLKTFLLSKI